jgi:hypothetical protein
MTTYHLNKLAKKYNVFDWCYVPSVVFVMDDGRTYVHQTIKDMESLFAQGTGNMVCILDPKTKDGKVRGTIVDKKYSKKLGILK